MAIETDNFEFDLPPGWELRNREGQRLTATGPEGQRLQVSSVAVHGEGTAAERAATINRVRQNAIRAIEAGAGESGLPVVRPLTSQRLAGGLYIDELNCGSRESVLLQCVIASDSAVLLITYEASSGAEHALAGYAQIVNSVRAV